MLSAFSDLQASVYKYVESNDFNRALDALRDFVFNMMIQQATPGETIGSRKLDELCQFVSRAYTRFAKIDISIDRKYSPAEKEVVILCTGLYKYGGTSLTIGDIIRAHPDHRCTVIATNYLDDMSDEDLHASRIEDVDSRVVVCPKGDATAKLAWLLRTISRIQPSRLFLLNHHQDSVLISAAHAFTKKVKTVFVHHADYNICLGVHMQNVVHADIHNVGFYNCRTSERIYDNAYLPLIVHDKGVTRCQANFLANNHFITCSSGSIHKFRNYYLYPYIDLIVERLLIREGHHVHIGHVPDHELDRMRSKIADRGIAQDRLVYVPWTRSLWMSLIEHEVDLFIGSFPIGGARTSIEAMGAGIPLLMPENYLSRFFSSRDVVYPNHLTWRYPDDFVNAIKNVDSFTLRGHSVRSRAHYDTNYSPDTINMKDIVDRICSRQDTPVAPQLYDHNPDQLDRAIHFTFIEGELIKQAVEKGVYDYMTAGVELPEEEKHEPAKEAARRGPISLQRFRNLIRLRN